MSSSQTNPKEVAQDLLIFPSAHGAPCSPTLLCWLGEKGLSPGREYPWRFCKRLMAVMVLTEGSALPLPCRKVSDTHTSIFVTFMRVLPLAEHEQAERI